ncbi:D-alanyl-D-alanine carboxypeptidase/D-alanyl-D-alanine-endopeptidase [Novosphingobium sp.]|uniref:D-alanyl-D-alanine carboxypeptidase/D-alanyl-D-alanine endopeptidase n=1 Tax=Novosphingobium sp. TaxID=1874826 RepID=UPI0035AE08C7
MVKRALIALSLMFSAPALAEEPPLQQQVEAVLATAPQGTRFGLLVVDENGREVIAINPDGRFIPASNTKLFTTAAAYAVLPGMDQPDVAGGTQVALVPVRAQEPNMYVGLTPDGPLPSGPIDVWLSGRGDARMSSAMDCVTDCLAALADAVAARTKRVHDIVGDDSFWPDQRWSQGMSWNNIGTDDGTAAGALNLDDNALSITVLPWTEGGPPAVEMPPYYKLDNQATTGPAGGKLTLAIERPVNGDVVRLYGSIPADSKGWATRVGIDDPAHYAAWIFRAMLEARGVKVTGKIIVNHRGVQAWDQPAPLDKLGTPISIGFPPLATLTPPPLADDVVTINKDSNNLHAQVLLRRVGDARGTGSDGWAIWELGSVLEKAGVPRTGYDFADGSGMSTYNRVSPRAVVALLRWGAAQPWGAAWRASFPVGGLDGTLTRRFKGTALEGKIWAKTGTLNATNALSGHFRTASGREFTFAFFANDVPGSVSATPMMDAALVLIAAQN